MQSDDLGLVDRLRASGTKNAPKSGDGVYMSICDEALAEIERLREVLKFYADREGWKGRFEQDGPSSIMHHSGPVLIDRGDRARQALGETP